MSQTDRTQANTRKTARRAAAVQSRAEPSPAGSTANQQSANQTAVLAVDYRWLFDVIQPYRLRLGLVLLLSFFSTGFALIVPYLGQFLIDNGLLSKRFDVVLWFCGLMMTAGLLASLLSVLKRWHAVDISTRIAHALRESLFAHLLRLPPAYFSHSQGADVLTQLDSDIAAVQTFGADTLLVFVNAVLVLLGAWVLLLSLNVSLALLTLLLLAANMFFLCIMRPQAEHQARVVRERTSAVSRFFFERLGAVKFIQSIAAELPELDRLRALNDALRTDTLRLRMVNYATRAVPGLLLSINSVLLFLLGAWYTIQGALTLGALLALTAYLVLATSPLQRLLDYYLAWQRVPLSLCRIQQIIRLQPAVRIPEKARSLPPNATGQLHFEHVALRYAKQPKPLLKDITIALPAGKKIALVGVSGVAKNALIDLLQRYHDPSSGRILLDGINLRELSLTELRRRIVIISPDTTLFSGTLLDNLRYAAPTASDAQLRQAARRAQVDEFAQQLPRAYDSEVGPRGSILSGVQRQRIAIARALLLEPLVLILDDTASALNTSTEASIPAIDQLFAGRTRLLLSHRSEALQSADVVLQLIGGYLIPQDRSGQRGVLH